MNEKEWLVSDNPSSMLDWLVNTGFLLIDNRRKLRLYAVACCRRLWEEFTDWRCYEAIEVAEQFADGKVTNEDLRNACLKATQAYFEEQNETARFGVIRCCSENTQWIAANDIYWGRSEQAELLRCIMGNPFHELIIESRYLTSDIYLLANAAYEERILDKCIKCNGTGNDGMLMGIPIVCCICKGKGYVNKGRLNPVRLNILADALEEAGCILNHLRNGNHVRGCYVLDLLIKSKG